MIFINTIYIQKRPGNGPFFVEIYTLTGFQTLSGYNNIILFRNVMKGLTKKLIREGSV